MVVSKKVLFFLVLCLAHQSLSKPTTENGLNEGRGIFSTIWGWITYPFSWWSSAKPEDPVTEQLGGFTTPYNDVSEISNSNITVWCNDQTCTTMRCDKTGCNNITCNVYDTNVKGECREYNMLPDEEHVVLMPTESTTKTPVPSDTTAKLQISSAKPSTEKDNDSLTNEKPLELEAILSSTVNQDIKDSENKKEGTTSETKV